MNIDPAAIEAAITPRTKALLPVHFAGRPADLDAIGAIARKHGLLVIEEVKEALEVEHLPGEEREGYHTLAGFLVSQLGRIPRTGEIVTWGGWRFEVLDMDGNRVDKVLVHPQRAGDAPELS